MESLKKRGRKGNANSVGEDGGVVDSDEEDAEDSKPPPEVITISDDSDAE